MSPSEFEDEVGPSRPDEIVGPPERSVGVKERVSAFEASVDADAKPPAKPPSASASASASPLRAMEATRAPGQSPESRMAATLAAATADEIATLRR